MRTLLCGLLCASTLFLGGCFNTYNTTKYPEGRQQAGLKAGKTIINVNPGMTNPMAPTTFAPTSYQEVYTTEYTPCGPVVKKAIVPIYGNTGMPSCNQGYMQQPMQPIPVQPCQPCVPVIPNNAPAQPVNPAAAEPVAWFGPTAAPTYSTQTSWF